VSRKRRKRSKAAVDAEAAEAEATTTTVPASWWQRFWYTEGATLHLALFRIGFAWCLWREIDTTHSKGTYAIEGGGFHLPYLDFIPLVSKTTFDWIHWLQYPLVLMIAAGLFLGTLRNLRSVPVGFDPANILLFRIDPTLNGYEDERLQQVYGRLRDRLAAVPGVRSVSLSQTAFLAGSVWVSGVHLPGRSDGDAIGAHMMTVSPEFFETMRIPLLAGRRFTESDTREGPRVAVINAKGARELFRGEHAVGRRFGFSREEPEEIEIIGVVRNVKYSEVRDDAPTTVYLSYLQDDDVESMVFELRTELDPRGLVPAVREAVRSVDPNIPLMDISTQAEEIEGRFQQERFFARAYTLFGGLATLLAAVGLFGLASYGVARRTSEIGIRMALGARGRDVFRLVLGESLRLVGMGIILGLIGTLAAGRFVQSRLYGVGPTDTATVVIAVVVLVLVAALAGYLPARRASRLDPMAALQYDG